jgi:hypothetical protein
MGKVATQEDFNNFIQADKKNIPIILRGVFSKDDANKVKANWRKYAKANGFNENIDHLKDNAMYGGCIGLFIGVIAIVIAIVAAAIF